MLLPVQVVQHVPAGELGTPRNFAVPPSFEQADCLTQWDTVGDVLTNSLAHEFRVSESLALMSLSSDGGCGYWKLCSTTGMRFLSVEEMFF
jgi:hypothetical protein